MGTSIHSIVKQSIMKKNILSVAVALVALFSYTTASAQKDSKPGVHENSPTTFDKDASDQSLRLCFDIAGLGSIESVDATVSYDIKTDTYCLTKGKGHGAEPDPGAIPAFSETATGQVTNIQLQVRNGRIVGCPYDLNNLITCAPGLCSSGTITTCFATYTNVKITILGNTFTAIAK